MHAVVTGNPIDSLCSIRHSIKVLACKGPFNRCNPTQFDRERYLTRGGQPKQPNEATGGQNSEPHGACIEYRRVCMSIEPFSLPPATATATATATSRIPFRPPRRRPPLTDRSPLSMSPLTPLARRHSSPSRLSTCSRADGRRVAGRHVQHEVHRAAAAAGGQAGIRRRQSRAAGGCVARRRRNVVASRVPRMKSGRGRGERGGGVWRE